MQGVELQVGSSYRPLACTAGKNKVHMACCCRVAEAEMHLNFWCLMLATRSTMHSTRVVQGEWLQQQQ